MNNIAMFGGAFDPIHNGHVYLAKTFVERLRLDQLLIIPTAQSPHKAGERLATEEQRLAMCRLAAEGLPYIGVSDREIRRGGKSYTVDTLYELREQYPNDRLFLLMGADMFLTLHEWHRFREILSLATICPVVRNEGTVKELQAAARRMGATIRLEEITPIPISSTAVRDLVRRGEPIEDLVPCAVARYIREQGLYRQ